MKQTDMGVVAGNGSKEVKTSNSAALNTVECSRINFILLDFTY
jgi:hypothetical protein